MIWFYLVLPLTTTLFLVAAFWIAILQRDHARERCRKLEAEIRQLDMILFADSEELGL